MNPLNDYPSVRKVLYAIQWIVNGVLVIAGAYFVLGDGSLSDAPRWYVVTAAISPILWTYLGITAQANVDTGPALPPAPGE